ncbi:MAG: hypothetical protein DRJ55_00590 [Thermoprotei archaeon]|nr:MAG: hypothetical protein DRJ55_00590 [Thermoprotei archaeon]HDJ97009.1 hypothetical protein [Thermofilum sp.]
MTNSLNINVKISYLHAERLAKTTPPKLGVNIQISFPSEEPQWGDAWVYMPFVFNLSTSPPAVTVTLRGYAEIKGEKKEIEKLRKEAGKGKFPSQIVQLVTSYTMFEAMLLMRELGFPPIMPIPQPGQTKPTTGPVGPL